MGMFVSKERSYWLMKSLFRWRSMSLACISLSSPDWYVEGWAVYNVIARTVADFKIKQNEIKEKSVRRNEKKKNFQKLSIIKML